MWGKSTLGAEHTTQDGPVLLPETLILPAAVSPRTLPLCVSGTPVILPCAVFIRPQERTPFPS